jgi:ATP-dependent helicase/nuclease subunit A
MMQDHGLVIVPAGAGSGKTHRIKETLSYWVKKKLVRPERILAVTFAEAAASELRERIRSGLLADGLVSEALAVERAYVSTIHGLGLRLLTEYALAAGVSPQPRHLSDAERDLLIRQALAKSSELDPIKADPERFGYRQNFESGDSVEDALRARVLGMVDLLRGLGDTGLDQGLVAPALARLEAIYGPTLKDPEAARSMLQDAISKMLVAFPGGATDGVQAKGPRETLEKNHALFRRVSSDITLLDRDWSAWQALRNLFTSTTRTQTPEGYDKCAAAIMDAANVLPQHPGPLADAKWHLECLIKCTQQVMTTYEAHKKSFGLIDYADMVSGAERLLRCDPAVRQAVLDEIDCVIIDEFQDTNPVQFALLWQLGRHSPRTLLVGDVKQSIMGFQGADPRLSVALAKAHPEAADPLEHNWRSTPAVMEFVNALGQGLFGKAYTPLAPTRDAVAGPALEVLVVDKGRTVRNGSRPPEHVAERIARILADGETVIDRHTKLVRPVRPSDIALLVYRHATAARYAVDLRARGVPVQIAEDGWAQSRAVQATKAALAYAANPTDVHSAILLRTIGPAPLSLQDALTLQIERRLFADPLLSRLSGLSDQILRLPMPEALDQVVAAAGLRDWVDSLPDRAQARADLLRLAAEAQAFVEAHRDLRAASGFHGDTPKVFLGWLEARGAERDFDRRPDPSAEVAEAVEIVTWHASKGREWPITVVVEFDYDIRERPGTTSVQFDALDRIDDMLAVLSSARLIHTPRFAAPEVQHRFVEDRRKDFEANARNLLYVALTRARDRLILEWPAFLKERDNDAPEASCLFHVLEDACDPKLGDNKLRIAGVSCPAVIRRMPEHARFSEFKDGSGQRAIRFGSATPMPAIPLSPWRLNPSQLTATGAGPATKGITLGDPWNVGPSNAARGSAIHLALRTFLARPDLAHRLPAATGLDTDTLTLLGERARALKDWLAAEGFGDLRSEIPVSERTEEGAVISGTIDLLASGSDGYLLLDYKTGGAGDGLGPYWPQLSAYASLLPAFMPGKSLQGIGIFWIDHGRLELASETSQLDVRASF